MRAHPEIGARMVALDKALRPSLPAVLYHHERWDGEGYPTGRAGAEIPLEARVLAVVDSYDAMTSDRPYRLAMPVGGRRRGGRPLRRHAVRPGRRGRVPRRVGVGRLRRHRRAARGRWLAARPSALRPSVSETRRR